MPSIYLLPGFAQGDNNIDVLEYTITYERSAFAKTFAVFIVASMWLLTIHNLVVSIDLVLVRPRKVWPEVAAYLCSLLFAFPVMRMLLEAPFGAYIDFVGLAPCMLLITVAGVIMYSGHHSSHTHNAAFFSRHDEDEPLEIQVTEEGQQALGRALVAAMARVAGAAGARQEVALKASGKEDD
jgi:hypothetical protein